MSIPLSFLSTLPKPPSGTSLGDYIAKHIAESGNVTTLLDCLCSASEPAIYSPKSFRPPISHGAVRKFVSEFALPHSTGRALGPNDRVMLALPTGPENALALLALASYHTCAPVNVSCTASELKEDAERLNVKALVTTRDAEDRLGLRGLHAELDCEIIYIEERTSGPAGLFDMRLMDDVDTLALSYLPSRPHGLDDRSLVLQTSGTSGRKKVVPYTLRSLIVGTWCVIHSWDLRSSDIGLNMMPLFHVGGIVRNLLAPIMSGGGTIVCSGFDPIAFWSLSTELRATWYYAAPTIHHAIISSRPDTSTSTYIRMIANAAGGLLPSLAIELKEVFHGAVILPSYGMTECMPIASPPTNYQLDRPGCSGIACGPYLSIRDPSDLEKELPCGKVGAVSVRGLPTFDGYEVSSNPSIALSVSAFTSEGWFDSGDVGYLDSDGYLYITGRSKEIINKGGEVISPFEVEEAIMTAAKDYVKNTLAFSVQHDILQETIGVVIVPVPNLPRIGLFQLHNLIKDYLHSSKWPFAIVYMNDLPKNGAGKPLRINLASRLGIGCLTDTVPLLHRHFEADVPHILAPLTDPIDCEKVSIDFDSVEKAIKTIPGVEELALRFRHDGPSEAFIYVNTESGHNSSSIVQIISRVLPGYSIPYPINVFTGPLARTANGDVDFNALKQETTRQRSSIMSQQELLVRDIVADLLLLEPVNITRDSDFFLLGGNSLLLGRLSHHIRKQSGASVAVTSLFSSSTIHGIASAIEETNAKQLPTETTSSDERHNGTARSSQTVLGCDYPQNFEPFVEPPRRGQTSVLNLIVQSLPLLFFYPLRAALTWTILLFALSYFTLFLGGSYWDRMGGLLLAIIVTALISRTFCPLVAIVFKWAIIGRYRTGVHQMWSPYYLRWWIVNQSLRSAGKGIFSMHPALLILYYRMLGARIGRNVHIDPDAMLGEYDLLTFHDGCRIDNSVIRGFCVERNGHFRLGKIIIGPRAVINVYTVISPGAIIAEDTVYGPHSSSQDMPSPLSHAAYNQTLIAQPHLLLQAFIAWPIILVIKFASHIPWFVSLWLMMDKTTFTKDSKLNAVEYVIFWFSSSRRVSFHILARVSREVLTPLLQLLLGIAVKRAFGLNSECLSEGSSQVSLLRRYINSSLLSPDVLKRAFSILGTHYEIVSVIFRAMGAKVGRRIYWPGSGIYCLDPEMLEIGDDVVFGSRSAFFTTDRIGTGKIVIRDGAMVADRVVLLPGTYIGRRTVMGSGALSKRDTVYEDDSTWIGCERGEAICLSKGPKQGQLNDSTLSPFGRAYYERKANYFVFPYSFIITVNFALMALSTVYWSVGPIVAAQFLRYWYIHLHPLHLFRIRWFRFGILYGFNAICFLIILNIQTVVCLLWVILAKWAILGRRREGKYEWDKSSYCQRWQLHLVLSYPIYKGHGNGGVLAPLTGSVYLVWYLRALGAKIGRNCAIFAGGRTGLMTEPDLVEMGDNVNLDDCSVVAHINSRGNFALNRLKIGNGSAMRVGSRLLSGASMEDNSMLCEHTLLTSGEVTEAGGIYIGWPAKRVESPKHMKENSLANNSKSATLVCPLCRKSPDVGTVTMCGHLFCEACIGRALKQDEKCPTCAEPLTIGSLRKAHAPFVV